MRARGCPCPVAARATADQSTAKRRSAGSGAARAPSPDVRYGLRGLRSLHAGCASASCLRWPPRPAPGARATPRWSHCKEDCSARCRAQHQKPEVSKQKSQDAMFCVKLASRHAPACGCAACVLRGMDAERSTSGRSPPRQNGLEGHVCREASVPGPPVPHRRTFATAFVASAHSMPAALRHPACAGRQGRLPGHWQPLAGRTAKKTAQHDAERSTRNRRFPSKNRRMRCLS